MLSQLSNNLFKVIQQYTVFRNPPLQFRRFLTRTYKQTIFAPGSYITLPEVPSLPTGEILNPLYDADYVPNFKNVKPIYIANALMEQCDEMEVKLNEIIHIASGMRCKYIQFLNTYSLLKHMCNFTIILLGIFPKLHH
ncbi:hypothetical protein GJ496_005745 [Pomphorhynchus laevis]|nr:hypothetical protein GJ496_005745 [Pomphorhynchus laevis]